MKVQRVRIEVLDRSGRHAIEPLDPGHANVGTAADLVTLLQRVWRDEISEPAATVELRRLMGMQMFTHRLASDLRSDTLRVSGKTGSYLHLRHEIGVVESLAPESGGRGCSRRPRWASASCRLSSSSV